MHRIAVIPGDGIGPEVIEQGIRILEKTAKLCHFELAFIHFPWGANHYLKSGEILPTHALENLRTHDAVYLGAIGDPRVPPGVLERGIVGALRWTLDLYVNLRPVKLYNADYSPLKEIRPSDLDILVVRENTEDIYTGPSGFIKKETADEMALAIAFYSRKGVERILRYAFQAARERRKKLTLCDKANAIPAQELWRRVFEEIGKEFPDIERQVIYVDACAMAMVRRPQDFDVIVTTNLFGDILTDLGAELCGGMGVAPSANIFPGEFGVFEPIHGSAPKYAGTGKANPIGAILAGAMMLEFLGEKKGATLIESATVEALQTKKLSSLGAGANLDTKEIGSLIESYLKV